jgi:hypothetical protein
MSLFFFFLLAWTFVLLGVRSGAQYRMKAQFLCGTAERVKHALDYFRVERP